MQIAFGNLRVAAPLLNQQLFSSGIANARRRQLLQESGTTCHTCGQCQQAVRCVQPVCAAPVMRIRHPMHQFKQCQRRHVRSSWRNVTLRHAGQYRAQLFHSRCNGSQPACDCLRMFALRAHPRRQLLTQRRIFRRQRSIEQINFQLGPCVIQLDHTIDRQRFLPKQRPRIFNQHLCGICGKPRAAGNFPARFRRAIQTLVVLAKIMHRLLERMLLRQRLNGCKFQWHDRRLMRQFQQRRIVGRRSIDACQPRLRFRVGDKRRARLSGGRRP